MLLNNLSGDRKNIEKYEYIYISMMLEKVIHCKEYCLLIEDENF